MRVAAIFFGLALCLGAVLLFVIAPTTHLTVTTLPNTPATSLPPEYPIGSVLMLGHWSHTPIASTTALIAQYQPGGVILMSAPDDPSEITRWIAAWQASSSQPLIIAIDQEGGEVSRLRGDGFTQATQRSVSSEAAAYALGIERGQELAALGINLNFAPVLDTATSTDSFLHNRTFADPAQAARFAAAMTRGMANSGVIAATKHFPGHPNSAVDSHYTLPTLPLTYAELPAFTKPFNDYIAQANPTALMTAHVAFPAIDAFPATLSPILLSTYLRDELGFTGVVITDDLSMDAIDTYYTVPEAAIMSLSAGADMILLAAEPESISEVASFIVTTKQTDPIFAAKLTEAQERVYQLQQKITTLDAH